MSTQTAPTVAPTDTGGDDLHHIVCSCDTDTSRCGRDVSDEPFTTGVGELACVVCAELEDTPCERCGA